MILRAQSSLQAGSPRVPFFGGVLWYPEFHPAFACVAMMSQGLRSAEMRNGFGCPIPHLDGMKMRGELILVITEPMDRAWGMSEGV